MADDIDLAQSETDLLQAQALANLRSNDRLKPTGRCYNCEESVGEAQLFCSPECRDDYEKLQWSKRMRGG